ncbi:hypothetical protein JTB14_024457 [Gonioctena quinquepunctata]|nr:hypothetical protein JTB14_024457 [Gonioctena quinquepunctata]
MLRLGHVISLLLLVLPLHLRADYRNNCEYVDDEDYEEPEVPDIREKKWKSGDEILVGTTRRGNVFQLNCAKNDVGGCAKRFLSVENGVKSVQIFEQENMEIIADKAGNYTCGCFLPEENFKNVTYKVLFTNDTAYLYKREFWGKYDAPTRSSSALVFGSPSYFMWMWIMFIYKIGR